MCDPMTYPLLHPNGESGWYINMTYTNTNNDQVPNWANPFADEVDPDTLPQENQNQQNVEVEGEPEWQPEDDLDIDPDEQIGTRRKK